MIAQSMVPVYKRILLKMSGEALTGNEHSGIDPNIVNRIAQDLLTVHQLGVEIGLVIGGGNLFRGAALSVMGIDRVTADHMGMLGTVMNALAIRDMLERVEVPTRVMSAIPLSGLVDHYDRRKATHHLSQGRVVIFAGGTGNPLVTTDSAASLRGIEINADVVIKATNVDGVYSADPARNVDAVMYHHLTYEEALQKQLAVMDLAAFCQCRDYNMPLRVFNINKPGALLRVVCGKDEGTTVSKN